MFKLYVRNPKTMGMEATLIKTWQQCYDLVMALWPDCTVGLTGEAIVHRERQYETKFGPVTRVTLLVVARVELT